MSSSFEYFDLFRIFLSCPVTSASGWIIQDLFYKHFSDAKCGSSLKSKQTNETTKTWVAWSTRTDFSENYIACWKVLLLKHHSGSQDNQFQECCRQDCKQFPLEQEKGLASSILQNLCLLGCRGMVCLPGCSTPAFIVCNPHLQTGLPVHALLSQLSKAMINSVATKKKHIH